MKFKRIFIFVMMILFLPINVRATTLQDLYNDLASLQSSYNAAQQKANMSQAELNKVKASISSIEAEVKQAQQDITKAESEIVESEEKIKSKKEETNQLLLYLQLNNTKGNSYLEYIFDAEDYTDLVYRYSVVSQMTDANNKLVEELNALITELNNKKTELNKKQETLASKKKDLQAKYLIVQAQYQDEHDEGLSVASQIADKKKLIKSYESMGCKKTDNINSCGGITAVSGWTYPISHFVQSSIYGESRGSKNHYAVDLAVSEGTAVKAVANGKVISASSSSCGGGVIQIQHNYNGSEYVSLYMHLINMYVSVGTKVSGGQTIGTSGGGPIEQAKWGDTCTEGAHLHFSMSSGPYAIGYSSQKGSTFNPVKFFPAMSGYGASL